MSASKIDGWRNPDALRFGWLAMLVRPFGFYPVWRKAGNIPGTFRTFPPVAFHYKGWPVETKWWLRRTAERRPPSTGGA